MNASVSHKEFVVAAITHIQEGEAKKGIEMLESLFEENDGSADAMFLLGALMVLGGQVDQGVGLVAKSHQVGKHTDDFFFLLGRLLTPFGERGESVRLLLQQRRLIPLQQAGLASPVTINKSDLGLVEPWYFSRKMTSFFPPKQAHFSGDKDKLLKNFVLDGWLPPAPVFVKGSKILTMGSCFAEELRNYLRENDLWSDVLFVPPGLNNTFALRNFIEWCITGVASDDAYWYEETDAGLSVKWAPEEESSRYGDIFRQIDGLVLTIGLSEVWEDKNTGGVFWRGVPKSIFNEDIHVCRLSTVEENSANIQKIINLVKSVNPDVEVIVTLSPVPLKATNQPFS